jgi:hypothetical protein
MNLMRHERELQICTIVQQYQFLRTSTRDSIVGQKTTTFKHQKQYFIFYFQPEREEFRYKC